MKEPIVKLLSSGYWHVRWSTNRWFQWPSWERPTIADGFGWVSEQDRQIAVSLTESDLAVYNLWADETAKAWAERAKTIGPEAAKI